MVDRGIVVLFQSGVTEFSETFSYYLTCIGGKAVGAEDNDLVSTLRINWALATLSHTFSCSASIHCSITFCEIHPEDDTNIVCRNPGNWSSSNAASHPQINEGIIDYTSLKTSHFDYLFDVTMSSSEFVMFEEICFYGKSNISQFSQ
jgi:hypothetical protein